MEVKTVEQQNQQAPTPVAQPQQAQTLVAGSQSGAGLSPLEKMNLVRQKEGLEPLTALPTTHKTEAEILAEKNRAEEDAKRVEAEKSEKEKLDAILAEKEHDKQELARKEEEERIRQEERERVLSEAKLDDEKLLAVLREKNPNIKSLDDIKRLQKTPEEIEAEKQAAENEKLAFGLQTAKFTKEKYEKYIQDTKNPVELVYSRQLEEAKAIDPELNERDFRSEFEEKYGISYDESSRRHKQGQKELSILADVIIRRDYSDIVSLDQDYAAHRDSKASEIAAVKKIAEYRPEYEKSVRSVVSSLKTIKVGNGDAAIDVEVSAKTLLALHDTMLSPETLKKAAAEGWTPEQISRIAETFIVNNDRNNLMQKYADAYHIDRMKGSRGIPPTRNVREMQTSSTMTEAQRKAAERHGYTPAAQQ